MKQEKSSESDLHRTICRLTLPMRAVTCDDLPACTERISRKRVYRLLRSAAHPPPPPPVPPSISICPSTPQRPLCQKEAGIKAFRKTLQSDYPFCMSLYVSCFCRSLSARQIVCHNRSFSLYLSFVKIQLQAGLPSFIIILAAFFHTRFKSGSKFPLCHHLWLINKTGLWRFSSQSDKTYLLP